MDKLKTAAYSALTTCMDLKQDESLLIVCDDNKEEIGRALYTVGQELAKDALLVTMPPADVNGQEPPKPVAELMARFDVVLCPTTKSLTHTDARRNACKTGTRVATMPGIETGIMERALKADYNVIARRTEKVTKILNNGKTARVTTALGTDLTLPINGIQAISSTGLIREKGMGGNLPSGESFLMPEEGKSHGVLVIDASVATIGTITSQPITVTIENGVAIRFEGGPEASQLEGILSQFGQAGLSVAELGIGTNHEATISGIILEDEKVLGTIHVAFGNNVGMGGSNNVGVHIDGVVTKPTVYIDHTLLMDNGKLLVD